MTTEQQLAKATERGDALKRARSERTERIRQHTAQQNAAVEKNARAVAEGGRLDVWALTANRTALAEARDEIAVLDHAIIIVETEIDGLASKVKTERLRTARPEPTFSPRQDPFSIAVNAD